MIKTALRLIRELRLSKIDDCYDTGWQDAVDTCEEICRMVLDRRSPCDICDAVCNFDDDEDDIPDEDNPEDESLPEDSAEDDESTQVFRFEIRVTPEGRK